MIDFKGLQQNNECMGRISDAGISIKYIDNVLHCSDEVAAQAIIDSFSIADAIVPLIAKIKVMAREKILAFLPEWKQSNFNARMNELNMIRNDREWTESEQLEVASLQVIWNQAKAIRQASNTHEANLSALTTFAEVAAYDITANW